MLAFNVPELADCAGLDVAGVCVPWLLVGLILGSLALFLTRALQALQQPARVLDGQQSDQFVFAGKPPRVSLVRLAPPPTETPRRARQR